MVCVGCVIVLSYSLWSLVCVIISEGFWLIMKTMTNINNHKCTFDALNSSTIHVWLSHHKSTQPNMHGIAIPLLHAHSHRYWTENMEEKQPPNYTFNTRSAYTGSCIHLHTCQPIQFTSIKYNLFFSLFWGDMAILEMDTGKHNFPEILLLF